MGQTILTPKQHEFLELAQSDAQIVKHFYLTGGTALAEFYLHHRLSEDIDLFTEKQEVDQTLTEAFLKKVSSKLHISSIDRSQFMGLFSYHLTYKDGQKLKVDFNYYPFPRIEPGTKFGKLSVDSLVDVAANKVHTLFMKPRTRDYMYPSGVAWDYSGTLNPRISPLYQYIKTFSGQSGDRYKMVSFFDK